MATTAAAPLPGQARHAGSGAGHALPPRGWGRRPCDGAGRCLPGQAAACDDGGCVVTFPALPQLMTRGVTCQHARIKALVLVEGYLRRLRARQGAAARRADQRRRAA